MRTVEWLTAKEAVERIQDGSVLATSGFVGCGHPEALTRALGERFRRTGAPRGLTLVYAAGQGDGGERGLNHLAHVGLLRRVVGGHWNLVPKLGALAAANEIEAYSLPQGVISKLFRASAAGEPGILSKVGMGTFVDPRLSGGKLSARAVEGLVEPMTVAGEEVLFYRALPVNAALIRATSADSFGGLSFEQDANVGEALSIAQAAKRRRGVVIAQVNRRVEDYSRDPKSVRVPGIFVDAVVLAGEEDRGQTYRDAYREEFLRQGALGGLRLGAVEQGPRRWIASRALEEMKDGAVVNLGIGMPEAIAQLACEQGCLDRFTLTLEVGVIGGVPASGLSFGASYLPHAVIDQPYMFDFYDGGGLDVACLSMAECDGEGNVNVSRFGKRTPGPGGFINIAQSTRKVVFVGTFTAGGLEVSFRDRDLKIEREGETAKFVERVQQRTFSGAVSRVHGQEILYVTERAVFRLGDEGPMLVEIAPGVDVRADVLGRMGFTPKIAPELRVMDARHFAPPA